jgi:hypothetical protein
LDKREKDARREEVMKDMKDTKRGDFMLCDCSIFEERL